MADPTDFEKFDKAMSGLLAVPYQELQKELEKDRKKKSRKKRANQSGESSKIVPVFAENCRAA